MVKEEWKMKVDQSVVFSILTLPPKVTILAVSYFSGKHSDSELGLPLEEDTAKKKIINF